MALKCVMVILMMCLSVSLAFPVGEGRGEMVGRELLHLFYIQGFVYCTPDGNPPSIINSTHHQLKFFADAEIHLVCSGGLLSSTVTNSEGKFEIYLNPIRDLLPNLLSSCQLQMTSPLNSCNITLPATGYLVSALTFFGNTILGSLLLYILGPTGFHGNVSLFAQRRGGGGGSGEFVLVFGVIEVDGDSGGGIGVSEALGGGGNRGFGREMKKGPKAASFRPAGCTKPLFLHAFLDD
ncbi:phylloplanin-like [Senna tora]|uniref:Phylloplanin-like n=1 Tax=Senna tora TaxID=362788 RepID=A0A835CCA0_9FABA|nr:phylloplanin-like [Senna tora]